MKKTVSSLRTERSDEAIQRKENRLHHCEHCKANQEKRTRLLRMNPRNDEREFRDKIKNKL